MFQKSSCLKKFSYFNGSERNKDFCWTLPKTENHKEKSEKKTEKEISLTKRPCVVTLSYKSCYSQAVLFIAKKRQQKIKEGDRKEHKSFLYKNLHIQVKERVQPGHLEGATGGELPSHSDCKGYEKFWFLKTFFCWSKKKDTKVLFTVHYTNK